MHKIDDKLLAFKMLLELAVALGVAWDGDKIKDEFRAANLHLKVTRGYSSLMIQLFVLLTSRKLGSPSGWLGCCVRR